MVTGENGAAAGIVPEAATLRSDGAGPPEEKPGGDPTGDTLRDGRVTAHPPNG